MQNTIPYDVSQNIYILGCSKIQDFHLKKRRNPPSISLGVTLKGSKRIFDLD